MVLYDVVLSDMCIPPAACLLRVKVYRLLVKKFMLCLLKLIIF